MTDDVYRRHARRLIREAEANREVELLNAAGRYAMATQTDPREALHIVRDAAEPGLYERILSDAIGPKPQPWPLDSARIDWTGDEPADEFVPTLQLVAAGLAGGLVVLAAGWAFGWWRR